MPIPLEELTERTIGCAIRVHATLGPGLLESIYTDCLVIELRVDALKVDVGRRVPVFYRGERARDDLRLDLLIDDRLVVEVKAVDRLHPIHQAQVISYLKLTGCPAGLLFNFNAQSLRAGLKRLDHPDEYAKRHSSRQQTNPP